MAGFYEQRERLTGNLAAQYLETVQHLTSQVMELKRLEMDPAAYKQQAWVESRERLEALKRVSSKDASDIAASHAASRPPTKKDRPKRIVKGLAPADMIALGLGSKPVEGPGEDKQAPEPQAGVPASVASVAVGSVMSGPSGLRHSGAAGGV
jgi:hypothetical protein